MSYQFFANIECEYYPCHKAETINCLFCFCPLYTMENCGGNFTNLESGDKDCSSCLLPHTRQGYDYVIKKLSK